MKHIYYYHKLRQLLQQKQNWPVKKDIEKLWSFAPTVGHPSDKRLKVTCSTGLRRNSSTMARLEPSAWKWRYPKRLPNVKTQNEDLLCFITVFIWTSKGCFLSTSFSMYKTLITSNKQNSDLILPSLLYWNSVELLITVNGTYRNTSIGSMGQKDVEQKSNEDDVLQPWRCCHWTPPKSPALDVVPGAERTRLVQKCRLVQIC